MKLSLITAFIIAAAASSAAAQEMPKTMKGALAVWLDRKLQLKQNGCEQLPYIGSITFHDFDGDKRDELIVEASTCLTGTAGFDVHMVVSQSKIQTGEPFIEWSIPQIVGPLYDRAAMTNSRNYSLSVKGDKLIATWRDESDRDAPLTIEYKSLGTLDTPNYKFAIYDIIYGK